MAQNPHTVPGFHSTLFAPNLVAIVPNDSTDLAITVRQIYVGTGGDVRVITDAGTTVTHRNVPAGCYIGPFNVARVTATGTTASDLVGYI